MHGLGLDPTALPASASVQDLVGAYAHVLGCVENDVNSQMTKVITVGTAGTSAEPLLNIYFRNSFNTHQRFFLENVKWALKPNSFYHDEAGGMLYYWPAPATAPRGSVPPLASKTVAPTPTPPTGVVAPIMDKLLDIVNVTAHVIANITFTDTTYYASWKSGKPFSTENLLSRTLMAFPQSNPSVISRVWPPPFSRFLLTCALLMMPLH